MMRIVIACVLAIILGVYPFHALPVRAAPAELFVSEYIEGSSNNKALEIFNGTGAAVNLAAGGYSIQMFFNGSGSAGLTINLTGTVADGDSYVLAQSSADPAILAQADQTNGSGWFNGNDAVVLRKGTAILDVIGQIGFNPGAEWGSGLASTADNTLRRKSSIQNGDPNGSDAFDPSVEWDGFATNAFDGLGFHAVDGLEYAPIVSSSIPRSGGTGVAVDANVTIAFSEPVNVVGSWFSISCASSGSHAATQSGGPQSFVLNPSTNFASNEACTVSIFAGQVSDQDANDPPDNMAANYSFGFVTETLTLAQIHAIQGATHRSPLEGQQVTTEGIVTVKASNGFWVQDSTPDGNDATSEGLFVFGTAAAGLVAVGDSIQVKGTVVEFRPGGSAQPNLTTTELTSPSVAVLSSANPLPAATVIGAGGRTPPTTTIEDDAAGDVETSGVFDPAEDGIDFYETLEGMRVQVNNAVAVGPRNSFGEIPVLGDNGAAASIRTPRGGIVIRAGDFNPERIILDDALQATPVVKVGDHFTTPIVGVMDYSFGNFKLLVTTVLASVDGGLSREVTQAPTDHEIVVGTYNVENLDAGDPDAAFAGHAQIIVQHLRSPDLLAIEEVQDNNGTTDDGVVDASATWNKLIAAIQAAGGPAYQYRQIDPANNADGGQPGGNIRVGFLFRTDRGLEFIDRPGGDATTPVQIVSTPSGPRLSASPGRIAPNDPAWSNPEGVRKPLVGEFRARGRKLFVIANHWKSKSGDQPLFGHFQPPTLLTEAQRKEEAKVVRAFVDEILALDPQANVIVLGDLNDFQFSGTLTTLKGSGDLELHALIESLPDGERYSYVFDGNAQTLDHIFVSNNLFAHFAFVYDVVHVNSEFPDQASDHEPQVVRLDLRGRPEPKSP